MISNDHIKILDFRLQKLSTIMYLYSKAKISLTTRCKFLTYLNILKFWEFFYDLCFINITDPSIVKRNFDNMFQKDIIINFIKKGESSSYIEELFLDFYYEYSKPVVEVLYEDIKDTLFRGKTQVEKITNITDLIMEHLNIHLLELEGLDISCKCLRDDYNISCPYEDEEETKNIIRISLVPEYFQKEDTLPKKLEALKKIKHPEQILIVIDFRVVVSRAKEIDVHNLIDICNKTIFNNIIESFGEIIFYKPFHGIKKNYENKKGYRIVSTCEELTKILEEHKEKTEKIYCSSNR